MPDREILFRGRRLDNGEWVEGYYVHNAAGQHMMVGGCHDKSYIMTEVDPSTVCRYTGLPDKHGTEAFVGDIIRYQDTCRTIYGIIRFGMIPNSDNRRKDVGFFIEWQNDGANLWGERWRNDLGYWLGQDENCEVIGNRWDNPELLPPQPGGEAPRD